MSSVLLTLCPAAHACPLPSAPLCCEHSVCWRRWTAASCKAGAQPPAAAPAPSRVSLSLPPGIRLIAITYLKCQGMMDQLTA